MLILTRFPGQAFNIFLENGESITIKTLEIQNSPNGLLSKIGIDAPKNINVLRTELIGKPHEKNKERK